MKGPTKLRNLKITKVDFVDNGANPDAHITLYKRRDPTPEGEGGTNMNVFERIGKSIMKNLGIEKPEDIEKLAASFNEEKVKSRVRRVFDNVWWDYQEALRRSLESIISDAAMNDADKATKIEATLNEFTTAMTKALTDASTQMAIENAITKSNGSETLDIMKSMRDELDELIEKAESGDDDDEDPEENLDDEEEPEPEDDDKSEKGDNDMKIDKSKMTPGEIAILEDLEKRYATEGEKEPEKKEEDVNKGIHPDVAAELAELKKFREDVESREMMDVAKKYEIIGKKAEELAPKLAEMKKSGSYADYIAILDEQVALVEKSGMFSEIGKRGENTADTDAWTQIEKKAEELRKSDATINYHESIDKACAMNPDLVSAYEKSRR